MSSKKPPIGVKPHLFWLEERIVELARALYEYTSQGLYGDDTTYKWMIELHELYRERDRYLERTKNEN